MKNVKLSSVLTTITSSAFYGSSALDTINIPSSVTKIMGYAFADTGFATLTVPSTVTSITSPAFSNIPVVKYSGPATGSPWGALSVIPITNN